mmetsp:Transcript_15362/g.30199  ORF Transcript_15362/g.30199 Transcript_15362/m.30199 type:complete len:265 (+) Transcript_15362:43-837(+)
MCNRNCCGAFWNIALVLALAATVFSPWYFTIARVEVDHKNETASCNVYKLYGWRTAYCALDSDCANTTKFPAKNVLQNLTCSSGSTYDWRDVEQGYSSNRGTTFDIGVGLATISFLCGLISAVGFFIRCCCKDTTGKSYLLIAVNLLGIFVLGGAVVYFALHLPLAYTADEDCKGPFSPFWTPGETVCTKLWGSEKKKAVDISGYSVDFEWKWGPVSWIVGVVALPVYLIVTCLSCTRSGEYASIQDGHRAPYHRIEHTASRYV